MKHTKILICLLLLHKICISQDHTERKIAILDFSTKQPIPYATIRSIDFKMGAYTNTEGVFTLTEDFTDTLYISSIGYSIRKIVRKNLANNTIYLEPHITGSAPVVIKQRGIIKEVNMGIL